MVWPLFYYTTWRHALCGASEKLDRFGCVFSRKYSTKRSVVFGKSAKAPQSVCSSINITISSGGGRALLSAKSNAPKHDFVGTVQALSSLKLQLFRAITFRARYSRVHP